MRYQLHNYIGAPEFAIQGEVLAATNDADVARRIARDLASDWCEGESPVPRALNSWAVAYQGLSDYGVAIVDTVARDAA